MPSARDLLQQADALMRSHRNVGAGEGSETVPVLTDVAIPAGAGVVTRQRVEEIPVLTNVVARAREPDLDLTIPDERPYSRVMFPSTQTESSLLPLSEMPSIPEFEQDKQDSAGVAGRQDESLQGRALEPAILSEETPKWLEADLLDSPLDAPAPSLEVESRVPQRDEWDSPPAPSSADCADESVPAGVSPADQQPAQPSDIEPSEALFEPIDPGASVSAEHEAPQDQAEARIAAAANDEPPPALNPPAALNAPAASNPPDALNVPSAFNPPPAFRPPRQPPTSAEELAETVYFQVLQNLDLYTERALQQHMTAHLSPIIERATQELLTTLNANLGALMRQFVADAVEKQLGERPASERPAQNP